MPKILAQNSCDLSLFKVTSNPDFILETGTSEDFLFMACDGIYEADVFGRQDVITWIANKMETTQDLALICAALLDECLERGIDSFMLAIRIFTYFL